MKQSKPSNTFLGHAIYQITVKEEVDLKFIENGNNMEVTHIKTDGQILSVISGEIENQTALNKLLKLLYNYRYEVISVMKLKSI